MPAAERSAGRAAQRRRTRQAILDAANRLLAEGASPSVDDIAAAADVSRRTVYTHFTGLEQLLLDATLGAMSAQEGVDAALDLDATGEDTTEDQVPERVDRLACGLLDMADAALPMGRRIIRLTVDNPPPALPPGEPRRGVRRTRWIEQAVQPWRDDLSPEQFDRLVSALSVVLGWEAMIVLRDLRGLPPGEERAVVRWAARALVDAMRAELGGEVPG